MSFLHPAVLVALLAIPLLIGWYVFQQRRRAPGPPRRSRRRR